jgi:hypothetical protein
MFWLGRSFFVVRAIAYLLAWLGLSLLLVRASRRARQHVSPSHSCVRIASLFLVVFAVTFWLASIDWIMSLEPRWVSTIFGLYNFAGSFVAAVALVIVVAVWFEHRGMLGGTLTSNQWGDLGTLLFAFSSFWMYCWFSQYLLIWYVNVPEETDYYLARSGPVWQPLVVANLVLNWGIPFLVLLLRPAKENRYVLLTVACVVLVGRWLDLSLMVLPPVLGDGRSLGIWDLCLVPGTIGVAALLLGGGSRLRLGDVSPPATGGIQ